MNVFQLTASEIAASDMYQDEQWEFLQRPKFRLATMNSRTREAMLDAMVLELKIKGGWFYQDEISSYNGPFRTAQAARHVGGRAS